MQPNQPPKVGVMSVVGIIGLVVALGATFFVAGEDHYPGRFFIERQAYWNGGTYYVKYTFLSVLFTLLDVVLIPGIIITGIGALLKSGDDQPPAPLGWDTAQKARRLKYVAFVLIATPLWLAYTGAAILAPAVLKPAGFFASILLLFIPIVPMGIAAFLFEALVSPRYVEGTLESLQVVVQKNNATAHLRVAGQDFTAVPALVTGLAEGARVGLIVSGFFKAILRIEKRG